MMNDVHWCLGAGHYANYEEFVAAVTEENENIAPDRHGWRPDEIVCKGPIRIQHLIPWKPAGEDLIEFTISTTEESLSMGQVLYRLHCESADFFKDAHHRHFERLGDPIDGAMFLTVGS